MNGLTICVRVPVCIFVRNRICIFSNARYRLWLQSHQNRFRYTFFGSWQVLFFFMTFKLTDYHLLYSGDLGGIAGSVWGGRWSDYELARLKAVNGGNSYPEVSGPDYCTMSTLFIV